MKFAISITLNRKWDKKLENFLSVPVLFTNFFIVSDNSMTDKTSVVENLKIPILLRVFL